MIKDIVKKALQEDIGSQDITTDFLISSKDKSAAYIIFKEKGVICGLKLAKEAFHEIDPKMKITFYHKDGDLVQKNTKIAKIEGKTRAIFTVERTALNFLGFLSGVASYTHEFVEKVAPYKTKILDTRKTTPGLRNLEKYAVTCGGGTNHRFGLYDMALIKDNHRHACHPEISIQEAVKRIRKRTNKKIQVEVDTLDQFMQALEAKPDLILLDNMTTRQLKKAVDITKKLKTKIPLLEASGGVSLRNVHSIAKTGVDRISIGSLTHSPRSIDISLDAI
ncbi:MAG: carboxylating nicotinate-nucleotide diphosphorylase [Candidatus Omnitrophica bacterium]|nr:carboxylating nicotinate-nucleotide diphosphorylase [Candidatus Omnitrophota bacterium]MBU4334833.1 carboxylating nicotinate-nucleotide diphosphorylase [Candidatus Omnitrophota bacterium]